MQNTVTKNTDETDVQKWILARDLIDMIREYQEDDVALEYLDGFSFALARIFEDDETPDWDLISSTLDKSWYGLRNHGEKADLSSLDKLYKLCERKIEKASLAQADLASD